MAIDSRYKLKTGEEVAYFPPIQNTDSPYASEAAMYADQSNQLKGYGYLVDGVGAFIYLGTLAGTAADYKGFGGGTGLDLRASNLAGDLSTAEKDAIKAKLSITSGGATSTEQINIKPTGTINGTNKIFTVPSAYVTGKIKVFRNGIRQTPTDDFTEVSTTSIEFVTAPVTDGEGAEKLLIDYTPQ